MRKAFLTVCALLAAHMLPAHAVSVLKLAPGEKIAIDGRLDEGAWQRAPVLDRFWQNFPQAEVEAPVRTEARFAADNHALYVAIRAFDPDMGALRAPSRAATTCSRTKTCWSSSSIRWARASSRTSTA